MRFGFDENIIKKGEELEVAYFGSVKNKYEGMKKLGRLNEEVRIKLTTAIENAKDIQNSKEYPTKPEKPFAFDLRMAIWHNFLKAGSYDLEPEKKHWKETSVKVSSIKPSDILFYSTVEYPCMDSAVHTDGFFVLQSNDGDRIVLCDVTGNTDEKVLAKKEEQVDVVILSPKTLNKDLKEDEDAWKALIKESADKIVDCLLGPKENLKAEKLIKEGEKFKTNIVHKNET